MLHHTSPQKRLERIIATQALIVQANLDLDAFMQLVVDVVQELTQAKGAVVELVEGDYMVYRAASLALSQHVGLRLQRANSLSGLCVNTATVLHCTDTESDPRVDAEACRKVGVRSMVCTPLFEDGVPVGVLKIMSEQTFGFDDEAVQTLSLMASALGAALGKQVAFEQMERVQEQLRASESRLHNILDHAHDAVISIDHEGRITQWNRASERLFGWSASEALGANVVDLVVPLTMRESFSSGLAGIEQQKNHISMNWRRELMALNRLGEELTLEASINLNYIANRLEITSFLHDISERKKLEETLRKMALTDGLTGLANRRFFMERLSQAIQRQNRQISGLALLFMDLNDFKKINDERGHDWGDKVLLEFARRIAESVRETDLVARLGGDEFVILADGIHDVEHARTLALKIVAKLDEAPVPGSLIQMATSIGISLFSPPCDAAHFLNQADNAMYAAKQQRFSHNRIAIYQAPTAV